MLNLILAVLATYRLALMIATEEGAFGVFAFIRGRIDPDQETWIGRGLNCPLCIGFWVALGITLLLAHHFPMSETEIVLHWLGIAGGAVVLHKWLERE